MTAEDMQYMTTGFVLFAHTWYNGYEEASDEKVLCLMRCIFFLFLWDCRDTKGGDTTSSGRG
jgi:hypothetical protein